MILYSHSVIPAHFTPPCLEKHMANEEASEKSVDLKLLESIFGRSGEPSGPKKERTPEELEQLRERINSLLRTLSYRAARDHRVALRPGRWAHLHPRGGRKQVQGYTHARARARSRSSPQAAETSRGRHLGLVA